MLEHFFTLFQGLDTVRHAPMDIMIGRVALVALGVVFVILGNRRILEPLLMIPMGFGMVVVNTGILHLPSTMAAITGTADGTLLLDPLVQAPSKLVDLMQIDALQPIYTLTFSNGLIACFVFMGIGSILDVGYVMARPFQSMFLALCAELGTVVTYPIAIHFAGLNPGEAASVAIIGGADGPMVLFTSLMLAPKYFVPITVIAYLYLSLTYGGYPYIAKFMIPKHLLALPPIPGKKPSKAPSAGARLGFAIIACGLLCLLFPVASPLFLSVFVGVAVKEAGIKEFTSLLSNQVLYGATFLLGLLLGVLCEARVLLDPVILPLLIMGITSLFFAAVGGILGGYVLYFWSGKKFNPIIGLAGVSCVPTTAKLAQKIVSDVNPNAIIMPHAIGANICGVITTAVFCGIYTSIIPMFFPEVLKIVQ